MPHDDAIHLQAIESGDFADEVLFDDPSTVVSLIHFADDSHAVRLDLVDRGFSVVLDTPAWLDLDTVLPEASVDEPALSSGYAIVESQASDDGAVHRVSIQGGDVVGRVSVVLMDTELAALRAALAASRDSIEAADQLDHDGEQTGNGIS